MASKKVLTKATFSNEQYQELSLLIFGRLDNAERDRFAHAENKPVSEKRRKLIDRFFQGHRDLMASIRNANAKTISARAKVEALVRGEIDVRRRHSPPVQSSADSLWFLSDDVLRQEEGADWKPYNIPNSFARCVYIEGKLVGELWAAVGEAARDSIAKTNRPPRKRAEKVVKQQAIVFPYLLEFLSRRNRRREYSNRELADELVRERGSELKVKPGKATTRLEQRVEEFRAAYPDLLPPRKSKKLIKR
jgi:hypothetical protein